MALRSAAAASSRGLVRRIYSAASTSPFVPPRTPAVAQGRERAEPSTNHFVSGSSLAIVFISFNFWSFQDLYRQLHIFGDFSLSYRWEFVDLRVNKNGGLFFFFSILIISVSRRKIAPTVILFLFIGWNIFILSQVILEFRLLFIVATLCMLRWVLLMYLVVYFSLSIALLFINSEHMAIYS